MADSEAWRAKFKPNFRQTRNVKYNWLICRRRRELSSLRKVLFVGQRRNEVVLYDKWREMADKRKKWPTLARRVGARRSERDRESQLDIYRSQLVAF